MTRASDHLTPSKPSSGISKSSIPDPDVPEGFNAMGHPIPVFRKKVAHQHCRAMGLESGKSFDAVRRVGAQLERDNPHEAMRVGMEYLDLTGVYRLFACLLASSEAEANDIETDDLPDPEDWSQL